MDKNTYSCLHKPIKINRNKMYILLLLGQLCVGKVAFGVDHNLTTDGNYATTADVADGLALAGTGGQVDINHEITNPGNTVLTSTNPELSTTINIGDAGSILFDETNQGINLSNLSNNATEININNLGTIGCTGTPNELFAAAINCLGSQSKFNLNNSGNITGKIHFGSNDNGLNQDIGSINGNIYSDAGNDIITIAGGSITGNIDTGTGNDTININGGTITGDIFGQAGADTININGGTLTGNINCGRDNDTINYNSGNITGTIDGGSSGSNTFNINGAFTTGDTISNFQTINVNSPGRLTINKAISELDTALTIRSGATVDIQSEGSITGADTGTITNNSSLNVQSGGSITGINTITNNSSGNISIRPNATDSIDVTSVDNAGNLVLGNPDPTVTDPVKIKCALNNNLGSITTLYSPVTITGDYTLNANSEHQMYIKNGTASKLTANNLNFAAGSKIAIKTMGNAPAIGDVVTIATATEAEPAFDPAQLRITSDQSLIKYDPVAITGFDLQATAARRTYAEAINDIITNPTPNFSTVATILANLAEDLDRLPQEMASSFEILGQSTIENLADNVSQIIPDLSVTRAVDLSMQSSSMVLEQINDRLAQGSNLNPTRFAGANQAVSGYAAGDYATKQHYWVKAFGINSRQKALTESKGYNANLGGFALGLDKSVNSKLLLGVSLSYSSTKVKTKDFIPDRSRIQSSQFTVYANYSQPQYYVNAYLGAGLNRYRTDRAVLGQNYHAKFNGIQPTVRMDIGMPKVINNVNITPNASLQYTHLRQQKYSETGAGFALKDVNAKNTHLLRGGLGAKWEFAKVNANNCVIPEFRMMGWYDLVNTKPQITTEFQGGGGMFPLQGDKAKKFTFNLGASLNYVKTGGFSVSFNYDLYAKKKFIGHGGSLLAKFSM